jgi:hypothetical protein
MIAKLVPIDEIEIHELANLTPLMQEGRFNALKQSIKELGQKVPIVLYRGKCIDGRHRIKAFRELEMKEILAISEDSKMSLEDVKEVILNGYEQRRHKTPTQIAIVAFREWKNYKSLGEKVTQGVIAEKYGIGIKQINRVKQLEELAGVSIIDLLFQANKINIGTMQNPILTDSLDSLIHYFKKFREIIVEQTNKSKVSEDFTDEETDTINRVVSELQYKFSNRMLKQISNVLYNSLDKTSEHDIEKTIKTSEEII